ncbi:helix-turn-helix domain-containing protein [Actinospica sp. MGRD01-02]|uniref:Helix-turn-helix domain-containing protein n=2 Tax=Actinospica acidithermotolerans TaxID=2828514 RepID=A0A941EBV3_9ACTN|nr:helix-turn-helix domain-containing protein [Actinospica acidithermotolerans]
MPQPPSRTPAPDTGAFVGPFAVGASGVDSESALHPTNVANAAWAGDADGLLSTEEVAALLGVDPSTLRRWRNAKPPEGPTFVPISERVTKYWRSDVLGWLSRMRVVTAAPATKKAGH